MKMRIKKEQRNSITLSLSPEELAILIPDSMPKSSTSITRLFEDFQAKDIRLSVTLSEEDLRELINGWMAKLKVKPNRIQIRMMRSKWASCSPEKNIIFNSLLRNMSKDFVEYVICHEFLHLKVPRHSKLFRSLLMTYMPDWKERVITTMKSILNKNSYDSIYNDLEQIMTETENN